MNLITKTLTICCVLATLQLNAQVQEKDRGFTGYKSYDNSYITPDLRRKHTVSFSPIFAFHSAYYRVPEPDISGNSQGVQPNGGIHLGYNYTILERRALKISITERKRNEVKVSAGFHFHILARGEWAASINFYRPLFRTRGRLFSWAFFSSYSLGVHNLPSNLEINNRAYINANLEIFRLRFGGMPLYFQGNLNYDITNNFLDKERMYAGIFLGLRYDFFKNNK